MDKISDDIKNRILLVKASKDSEELQKNLCPFFEKGGCPDCIACDKSEAALEECKEIYLERIVAMPITVWNESFEVTTVYGREKVNPSDILGIGMACNRCYMSEKCPLFKRDYACGIDWGNNIPNTPAEFMDFLINMQYERVKRSSVFEKIDGGVPDAGLSGEIDRLHDLIASKAEMGRDRLSISVEASGSSTTSAGGGILSKLFGGSNSQPTENKPLEITSKPTSMKDGFDVQDVVEIKDEPSKIPRQRKR